MNELIPYIPLLAQGLCVTVGAWACAAGISLLLGSILGFMSCNQFGYTRLTYLIRTYTFIAKGIPAYVQILIAYFVVPKLLGINVPGFVAASCALALCSSGYVTEIIRSGINTIARGQWDAAFVLGYSTQATVTRIIVPQLFRISMPALLGELEQLLKSTSLLATIGVTEVTRAGMNIISRELNPLPVYLTIACIYLACSAILNLAIIYTQRKNYYGNY